MRLFFIWIVLLFSPIQSWKLIPKRTVVRADIHAAKSSCPANLQRSVSATENNSQRYKVALDILDCLTSPKDDSDPQYDAEKDLRRDSLLLSNDYSQLKTILRKKGLRTSGDKQEMITRLLLHEIDPSIKFDEM